MPRPLVLLFGLLGMAVRPMAVEAVSPDDIRARLQQIGPEIAEVYRQEAVEYLRRHGEAVVPYLFDVLGDPRRRLAAIEILGDLRSPESLAPLLRLYAKVPAPEVRCRILQALGHLQEVSLMEFFAAQLAHQDPNIRACAAWALGEIRRPQAVPFLLQALDRETGYARIAVVDALGKCGSVGVAPRLLGFLKYQDVALRLVAAKALGNVSGSEQAPALLRAMVLETDPEVRETLAVSVGRAGGPRVMADLIDLLKEATEPELQHLAETALGAAGLQAAFAVTPLLKSPEWRLRLAAVKVLGTLRAPGSAPALLEMARRGDATERVAALRALASCGDASLSDEVRPFTRAGPIEVRQAALEALSAWTKRDRQTN